MFPLRVRVHAMCLGRSLMLAWFFLLATSHEALAQFSSGASDADLRAAKRCLDREAKGILRFAYPTVTYVSHEFGKPYEVKGGTRIPLILQWTWNGDSGYVVLHFGVLKETGKITDVVNGKTSAILPPFSELNLVFGIVKDLIRGSDQLKEDKVLMDLINVPEANPREILVRILQIIQ